MNSNGIHLGIPIIANIALVTLSSGSIGLLPALAMALALILSATAITS